jgi:hypothetical protein
MKGLYASVIVLMLALSIPILAGQRFPANYPVTSKRIHFQRGRTTAIVKGVARTPGIYEYILGANEGQTMSVHLTSSNKGVEFTIFAPNGSEIDNALGVDDWSGQLTSSGDYKITLINNRPRAEKNHSYTLEVTIR